ncbi:MAG: hypothetical protein ACI4AD_13675 [Roseburia sp.]
MTKVQRLLFAISMTVVWGLLMPPYLYGILGIPVTFVFTFLLGRQLPDLWRFLRERFRWYAVLPVVLLLYMLDMEFYDQWHLSSKMLALAGLVGMDVKPFLITASILASVVAALGLLYISCGICGARPQKELPEHPEEGAGRKLLPADILFALAIALCLGMRLAFNPWSGVWPENDSSAYLYVGMMMRKGAVLYTDIFEHKGIILYLLDAIGLWLTDGSWTGVWILEVLNAFATALLIFKVTKLLTTKKAVQYITVAALIAALTVCMLLTDGNLSEEWVLPWITLAVYVFLKYFIDGSYRFYHIILLGVGFAFIVFVRANMIAAWIAFMPLVLVVMIRDKKWKDLWICIGNFLLGCAIVTVPVVLYGIRTGSLREMMECYFVFSFSYSGKSAMPIWQVMWLLFQRLTVYSMVLVGAARIYYKNSIFRMNLWFYAVSLVLASMSGRAHAHYAIILIPALIVPVVLLLSSLEGVHFKKPVPVLMALAYGFFAAQFLVSFVTNSEPQLSDVAVYLQENTSEDDNVFMMGNSCIYYLQSGRYTTNRFFYQTPAINISDQIYEEYKQEMEAHKPDMVILVGDKEKLLEEEDNYAESILAMDAWCEEGIYTCEEQDGFYAYRLRIGE